MADGWTDRHMKVWIDRFIDRRVKTDRQKGEDRRIKERKKGELFNRQANGWTDRQTDMKVWIDIDKID